MICITESDHDYNLNEIKRKENILYERYISDHNND